MHIGFGINQTLVQSSPIPLTGYAMLGKTISSL